MNKKFFALVLLIAILATSSCGETVSTKADTTAGTAEVETSDPNYDSNGFLKDSLPVDLDFKGNEVNWFCGDYSSAYFDDIWADDQNGNMVNDAVFTARRTVEDRLHVSVNVNRYEFVWAGVSEYNNLMKSLIMSGDTTYDAFVGYTLVPLIIEGGCFQDLSTATYLDLDKPWWNQNARELMPDDTIYFVTGDATLSLMKHSLCVYFNQDLLTSYGITENMYDVVKSGKWTLDKLESLIKDTYKDVNGNAESDINDSFGMTFGDANKYRMLSSALGVDMYVKNKDTYEMTFISERTADVFTRMQSLVLNNENVMKAITTEDSIMDSFGGNKVSKIFTSGRSLFTASLVGDAATILDNSKFSVGMIPYPKFNEEQDDYYTSAQRFAHIYVPSTVTGNQYDRASAVLEAWASECYRTVMPTYFETNLKVRYATDNDMADMFDLLRENTLVEFGTVFYSMLSLNCDTFKNVDKEAWNFASESEAVREKNLTQLEELVTALKGE